MCELDFLKDELETVLVVMGHDDIDLNKITFETRICDLNIDIEKALSNLYKDLGLIVHAKERILKVAKMYHDELWSGKEKSNPQIEEDKTMNMFSLSVDGWFYKATIHDKAKAELVYGILDGLGDNNEELLRDVIRIFEVLGAEIEATRVDSGAKYYYNNSKCF